MGRISGSSSACRDHHWKEASGVCPSCLTERLLALTCASKARKSSTDNSEKSAKGDSNRVTNNLSKDLSSFSTTDGSTFAWQRSKSLGKGGLQCGRISKEFLCDTEDDQRLCLVYFDSDMADSDLSCSQDKSFKAADSCGKGGFALAGRKAHCSRSSSVRLDRGPKPGKRPKFVWTPSTIFRRLFAGTKATMARSTAHQSEESYDLPAPAAGLVRASSLLEGISSSDFKSSSLKKVSSFGGDGSDAKESQRSDLEKTHPLRRVIPVTSTGCYDRITETMKHESAHKFPYQSCSKESVSQLGGRPVWSKAIGSPLRIFTKKSSYNSHEKDQGIDLDKHFQGATSSWSIANTLVEQDRRPTHQSPAHTAFYKDQSQLSFRSSPMQMRKCRRKKAMESRHGIFHLSPYSSGNDGWNCYLSPMAYRRSSTVKHKLI